MLRLAEAHRREGDLDAARRAYRRSISLFRQNGFEIKALAVQRALEGLRPPPPKPSRARAIVERAFLIIACALVSVVARIAGAAAPGKAVAEARRAAAQPALAATTASAALATAGRRADPHRPS
jgi:hypothetical protein